jgi:two-component system, NarL family, sensor histidine kinase DesK
MLRAAAIDLETDMAPVQLAPAEENVLSLVLREAVTNVVRHSQATRCSVTLSEADGLRTLCVEDDGRGKGVPDGNGITGMRERVASLGGTLAVESFPGTRVRATLMAGHSAASGPKLAQEPSVRLPASA